MTDHDDALLLGLGALAFFLLRGPTTAAFGTSGGAGGGAEELAPVPIAPIPQPGYYGSPTRNPNATDYYTYEGGTPPRSYVESTGQVVPTGPLSSFFRTAAPGSQVAHVGVPGDTGSGFKIGDITPQIPTWNPSTYTGRPSGRNRNLDNPTPRTPFQLPPGTSGRTVTAAQIAERRGTSAPAAPPTSSLPRGGTIATRQERRSSGGGTNRPRGGTVAQRLERRNTTPAQPAAAPTPAPKPAYTLSSWRRDLWRRS